MKNDALNIAEIVEESHILGPGKRFVIWVQGCKIRCKGCWNQEMWSMEPNKIITINDLTNKILSVKGIEGITILGGEPLHQAPQLLKLVQNIRKNNLTTMLYTGYNRHEIIEPAAVKLINISDIVVIGPYMEEYRSIYLKWRGSSNQEIIFNNREYELKFRKELEENQIEIHITDKGEITLLGYPPDEMRKEVLN